MNAETRAKLKDAIEAAIAEIRQSAVSTFACADKRPFSAQIIVDINNNLNVTVEYRVKNFPRPREK